MHDIPGKLLWLIVLFVVIIGFFGITTTEVTMLDKRSLYTDMCDFVDSVVDSRMVTSSEIKEFEARIASYGFSVDYEIQYLRRVDTPVDSGGSLTNTFKTVWVDADWEVDEELSKGDKIVVHVWALGNTRTQNMLTAVSSLWVKPFDETVPARIR